MKKPSVIIIDNYDSFVYNLYHYLDSLDAEVTIVRNDEVDLDEIAHYDKILLSPGPGLPSEAGMLCEIIKNYYLSKNIFGVCLGQQAIAEVFGGTLKNLHKVYHGVAHQIKVSENHGILFSKLPKEFKVGRYHSWTIDQLPKGFITTSVDENREIMSIQHQSLPIYGVQFHPESILTQHGKQIIKNWLYQF
ncbi:aminodeoxychorismate/anthranilate synthase component II [Mesonia sp. K7]|uniref:anthranilate synthase component II n=1 Tax=Mesonia sp. K7 TaxID=2218606 RepID=UPI000DA91594|nr:aminodeoxychorismate/anthranilate synthase component II [Mesonia sp. K7]PZD79713.1 aminodeoxychorismate/anthranilate synthase component II [Mesonia sp. K7]